MTPEIHIGDCLDVLAELPAGSVQCCVTSPPYFGLRDYGVPPTDWPAIEFAPMPGLPHVSIPAMSSCLGLELDPWAFVGHLVEVFRRVRRVLRDDGVAFVNLGDSYNAAGRIGHGTRIGYKQGTNRASANGSDDSRPSVDGLKPKDLIGIPWRVAYALQADGWFLRQDIIWAKPNPMPESVRDRCTKAHEYVFLLSKRERYFWDAAAVAETGTNRPPGNSRPTKNGSAAAADQRFRTSAGLHEITAAETRNRRSVWNIATQPYSGAHFATFPPALVEPCILAGSRPGDTVLDPFGGTGTVGSVAVYHGRESILIDVNPANEALMAERLEKHATPLFDEPAPKAVQEALL